MSALHTQHIFNTKDPEYIACIPGLINTHP